MKFKKDRAKFTALCMIGTLMLLWACITFSQSQKLNQQERQMRQMLKDYIELNNQCRQMDSIIISMDSLVHTLLDKVAEQHALPPQE